MPLFSEHISNMYYGASSPYSSPYSSYSSVTPHGSSYSASYLNPGGTYSSHSSLGGYSRPSPVQRSSPVSSRWVTSSGRNYAPMLSTITERGTASPVRINSPRRISYTNRVYATPSYTPRPININTADIDVSKDRYRNKHENAAPTPPAPEPENEGPFMPRVDGKPETGIDSSPGIIQRSTIRRGRTVVRLHTVKRKEKSSPRGSQSELNQDQADVADGEPENITEDVDQNEPTMGWREKLSEDLAYKDKKEKKTIGAKLVEKFIVKDKDSDSDGSYKERKKKAENVEAANSLPTSPLPMSTSVYSRSPDRRCSIEMLAEQAQVLDTLIRGENLSTARLDLSKVGISEQGDTQRQASVKRRKSNNEVNPLQTTKSDHALHQNLKFKDAKNFSKKRSLQKSSSGGSICRLDSITEFPKIDPSSSDLPAIEEMRTSIKRNSIKQKPKPKLKAVITSSVEVSPPMSPLKFKVDVTVEEKPATPKTLKKEIIYSSVIEDVKQTKDTEQTPEIIPKVDKGPKKYIKKKTKTLIGEANIESPEPDDGNFWDKIGKRETIYLIKRKQIIDETLEKNRRAFFWFPEDEEAEINNEVDTSQDNNLFSDKSMEKSKLETQNTSDIVKNKEENKQKTANEITELSSEINTPDITKKIEIDVKSESKVILQDEPSIQELSIKPLLINIVQDAKEMKLPETTLPQSIAVAINETEKELPQITTKNKTASDSSKDNEKIVIQENTPKINSETDKYNKQTVIIPINNILLSKNTAEPNTENTKKDDEKTVSDTCPSCGGKVEEATINKNIKVNLKNPDETVVKLDTDTQVKVVPETNKIVLPDTSIPEISKPNNKIEKKVTPPGKGLMKEKKSTDPKVVVKDNKLSGKSSSDKAKKSSLEKKTGLPNNKENKKVTGTPLKATNSQDKIDEKIFAIAQKEEVNDTKVEPDTATSGKDSISKQKVEEAVSIPKIEESTIIETEAAKAPEVPTVIESKNIPNINNEIETNKPVLAQENIVGSDKKDVSIPITIVSLEVPAPSQPEVVKPPTPKRPVKQEAAVRPLIATPRNLQKKVPQVIHSSSSSSSSSEEESSEDEDADESDASEGSTEFFECENHPDGRTSTGSNDSGFDSSAPTSPAGFLHIKKDCDVNCHWKCEKLTANLCGVNQRLLVEALASRTASKRGGETPGTSGKAPAPGDTADLVEHELEQSTAYGLFRRTGRFTPPARSIPRFRKYNIEDFHFIKVLGKGSFGKVMLAELRDTEYYYAVKCLKKDVVLEDDDVECTLIERKVLALGTNHPYLCHLFATFQTDCHLFFVMDYLNGGDLMFHIQQSGRFPEARARFYAAEIVSGLKFLHKRGIVYRDLKLDNILLDFDGHVRIADFGMCKLQIYLDKTADTFCGTPDYMAPEIIKGLKYNQTVDWWSFGVLLYEMLIGQSPFSGCDEDELFWSICNEIPSYPRFLSTESLTILTRLLDKDMTTRLGGTECMHGDVRDQDFFNAIHWDRLERRELDAPFRPRVRHPLDTQYFDRAFTGERPRLTAVEPQVLRSMDQAPFRGFSYTNPNATDH